MSIVREKQLNGINGERRERMKHVKIISTVKDEAGMPRIAQDENKNCEEWLGYLKAFNYIVPIPGFSQLYYFLNYYCTSKVQDGAVED